MATPPLYSSYSPPFSFEEIECVGKINKENMSASCNVDLQTQRRFLALENHRFYTIYQLMKNFPSATNNLLFIAHAINYLANGNDSKVIEDPQSFQDQYNKDYQENSDISYCDPYDTEEIVPPSLKGNKLIFFVEQDSFPKKVLCQWPVQSDSTIQCEILEPKPDSD